LSSTFFKMRIAGLERAKVLKDAQHTYRRRNNGSWALDNSTAQSFDLAETQEYRAFGHCLTSTGYHLNLRFPSYILRKNSREYIRLIAYTRGRDNLEFVSIFNGFE